MRQDKHFQTYVVDDDPATCHSVASVLHSVHQNARCFDSAEAFLEALDDSFAGCLVTDLRLSGMNGLSLIEEVNKTNAPLVPVVITGFGDVASAVRAIRLGAIDVMEKPLKPLDLLERIHEALQEAERRWRFTVNIRQTESRMESLSVREREVMDRLLGGAANKEIALELRISEKTVSAHRTRLLGKMGVGNLAELAGLVLRVDAA